MQRLDLIAADSQREAETTETSLLLHATFLSQPHRIRIVSFFVSSDIRLSVCLSLEPLLSVPLTVWFLPR